MITSNLHTHTTYCDGNNSPEEMVLAAIKKGLTTLGFSVHSYTDFDTSYCIKEDRIPEYIREISDLKKKYKGKINIFCGVEQDYFSEYPTDMFDFVIGSVHYVKSGDKLYTIDHTEEGFLQMVNEGFAGDFYKMAQEYYKTVSDVARKTNADIIGHIDLITKFNEGGRLFDENDSRYIAAYESAVENLCKYKIPFEINTGAISRGYRTIPYPSLPILECIYKNGGKTILSSDSHSTDTICCGFDEFEHLLQNR